MSLILYSIYVTATEEVVFTKSVLETINTPTYTVKCHQSQVAQAVVGH